MAMPLLPTIFNFSILRHPKLGYVKVLNVHQLACALITTKSAKYYFFANLVIWVLIHWSFPPPPQSSRRLLTYSPVVPGPWIASDQLPALICLQENAERSGIAGIVVFGRDVGSQVGSQPHPPARRLR